MKIPIFIAQFLPLLFFYLFFAYPDIILNISLTPLGRFIAICIIIFYTNLHLVYGLIVCILVILYYQMDLVEGMTNLSTPSPSPSENTIRSKSLDKKHNNEDDEWDIFDWMFPAPNETYSADPYTGEPIEMAENIEGFDTNIDANKFRQDNCHNGQLMYKNKIVNNENADHVFPELEFLRENCNVCDKNCAVSIIKNKLSVQEELTYPKVSTDWTTNVWNTWFSEDHAKPFASVGVISEYFSTI